MDADKLIEILEAEAQQMDRMAKAKVGQNEAEKVVFEIVEEMLWSLAHRIRMTEIGE